MEMKGSPSPESAEVAFLALTDLTFAFGLGRLGEDFVELFRLFAVFRKFFGVLACSRKLSDTF